MRRSRRIRTFVLATVVATLSLAVGAAAMVSGTPASKAPYRKVVARYCSPTGDLCLSIVNRSGGIFLNLDIAARYFRSFRLCVRPPGAGSVRCGSFGTFRNGPTAWYSSVRYAQFFPVVGDGTYRVTWMLRARRLGPTLRFKLPLAR